MLRITMSKSASGAKKYYSEEYYREGENNSIDYYSEKDQVIGQWGGMGAAKLELGKDVSKDDFAALCDNLNPLSGEKLTGRNDIDRTVGYDFTFNASKSVSLAYSFGNDEDKKQIVEAFRAAVADAMKEVETGMQARVRKSGQNENRETANIVYGEFTHFTTRPVDGRLDCHLHSHCFVFNATFDEKDEKWKAGQFRQIKQDAPYYEAYFHSTLAEKLENLGYGIERTRNSFELRGIDKETINKFSRRTAEIEEHAREHGITDDKQKSQIGAKTREAKRVDINPEKEFAEWLSRLSAEELEKIRNLKRYSGEHPASGNSETAKNAVNFALNHYLERKSVASDKEILSTAIKSSTGLISPEAIKKEFKDNKNILSIKENLRTFITTKEALKEEKDLIANATSFKGKFRPINEIYEIKSGILNDEQKRAVKYALGSSDGITIIAGKAGTGKTTLMKEVQHGIHEGGKEIFAFAPSSEASRVVQRKEGFENADTVASLILNKSEHCKLKNQVIWVDEAGMLSNKDMNKILAIAKEHNSRVILSGDIRQHNSVERGDALRTIQKHACIAPITVSKIQRQKNAGYREAVKMLSEANIEKGFKKLDNIGFIQEIVDSKDRIKAVAEDYYHSTYEGKRQKEVLVIAPTHAEGQVVTAAIRQKLKDYKILSNDEREFTILKSLQLTGPEKQKAENYSPGNMLVFHQNIKGIKAGTRLEVTEANSENIFSKDASGKEHIVSLAVTSNFNVFETMKIKVAIGDKITPNKNGKTLEGIHIFNGIGNIVRAFDKEGNIKLSNGATLSKDYGHFMYGYVKTSHSSQGKTADKVIVSQSSMSLKAGSQEQFYVSVSRGRQAASIYTDNKESLLHAVSQSSQRISATELMEKMKNLSIENSRLSMAKKMKDATAQTIEKLKTTITKNYEFYRKAGPGKR